MIEALKATALMLGLAVDALLSVFWWWGPLLLAALAVAAWRSLRPTGTHRLPRQTATTTGDDAQTPPQAPTGGDWDTMPLTIAQAPQAPAEGAEQADG